MKLTVLGSGSRGNAFLLSAAGCTLLIDAGFGPRVLMKRARAAGVPLDALSGIVLTHEHGDHSKGAQGVARRTGCSVYASRGTLTAMREELAPVSQKPLDLHRTAHIGPFRVNASLISHDAFEPIAVAVTGPGNRAKVGIATDLGRITRGVQYLMKDATCLLVEANHDEVLLRGGPYPPTVRQRIGGSRGHLSNRAAGEWLAELCHPDLKCIVLVHLSEMCNEPDLARDEVRFHLARKQFKGRLLVADQDAPMETMQIASDPMQLELGVG